MRSSVEEIAERSVQLRGSRLARALLAACGWRVVFDGLPSRRGVVVLYPHTSNWDFVFAMLARWSIGLQVAFWGKASLFDLPLVGRWLRWLGGIPVRRDSPQGAAGQMTDRMLQAALRDEFFWLGLASEGTRSLAGGWRSGFHQVCVRAAVPLALAFIDYPSRQVGVRAFLRLSGDADRDVAAIAERLAGVRGKRPELAAPIRFGGRA